MSGELRSAGLDIRALQARERTVGCVLALKPTGCNDFAPSFDVKAGVLQPVETVRKLSSKPKQ